MRKLLELGILSLLLTAAMGPPSALLAQQTAVLPDSKPGVTIQVSPTPLSERSSQALDEANWLRTQLAREAAFRAGQSGQASNVLVGYQPPASASQEATSNSASPDAALQISPNTPTFPQVTPEAPQAGQPVSPLRRIPELTIPNTSLDGLGVRPKDALADYPFEQVGLPIGVTRVGDWTELCACWQASGICHLPLYFEEPMLERHGQQRYPCLQPMISGARFIGNIAMLPYYMQLDPPWEDQSVLGSYRPGSAAPALYHRPPYRADAVTAEGLATAAIFLAVP